MEGYVKAPHDIVRDPSLSAMAKVAWLLIAGMPDGRHPTREQWMSMLPCGDKRTWWRAVSELERAGLVEIETVGPRRFYRVKQDRYIKCTEIGANNVPNLGAENAPYKKNIEEQKKNNSEARTRLREEVTCDMMVEMGCRSCGITQEQYNRLAEEIFTDWEFTDLPDQEWSKQHFLAVLRIKAKELKRNAVHQQTPKRKTTVTGPISGATQEENPLAGYPTYNKTGS